MAMNAHAQSLVGLITSANLRFVIPVYQRPYSWDEEQCEQLWDDILYVGTHPQERHFTGSVVWVQDGTLSASGITPMLLIDGQQRITTLILIIATLADYARNNQDKSLRFSYEEIIQRGYLVDTFRQGEDRYKLTLTRGDRRTLESIIEQLVDADCAIDRESAKLIENLEFFRKRINALEDPNTVWDGLQRLDVVSISLDANQDNPQLIFESMNSTGKDLSSADLIRNYVLMGLPKEEQDSLYLNHWRNIEVTLGADVYETIFDEFLRNYLTVLYAPEPLARRDIYHIFKRHVTSRGYDKDGRIVELLKEMERFALYYSHIINGTDADPARRYVLSNLRKLNVTVVNPLLLSFYDDFNQGAFGEEDFLRMLKLTESYVLRRSICDVGTNSLNKFLPSVIAKLNKVQDDGGDYARAFEAFLMLEAGTARRFPDNAEFFNALTARNIYHYRKSFYLLSNLENHHHPKDPLNLTSETFSIEHVMPQNALASPGWELSSSDIDEEAFSSLVNNLGNLTLTAYNPELSDDSFQEKKQRYIGGYGKDYLVISNAMRQADSWDADSIKNRAAELAHDAEARWPYPVISMAEAKVFEPKKPDSATERSAVFRTIFDAGLIKPGVRLFPKDDTLKTIATVTESGLIELPNGELFKSPSLAAVRVVALARGSASARNGWHFWKVEEDGPLLDELRSKYLLMKGSSVTADVRSFHMTFWDGFYDFCANSEDFTDFFGDPSTRGDNKGCWTSFGMGTPGMRLSVLLYVCPSIVGVQLHCRDSSSYARVLPLKEEFNVKWQDENVGSIEWDTPDEDKKSRNVQVLKDADYDHDDWNDLYQWLVTWLFKVRELALRANEDQHI